MTTARPALRLVAPEGDRRQRDEAVPRVRERGESRRVPETPARQAARNAYADSTQRDVGMLLGATGLLCLVGLVMVMAASALASVEEYGSTWGLFERQVVWMVVGGVAFLAGQRLDTGVLRRLRLVLLFGTLLLLAAVLVPGVGQLAGGSSRWIGTGEIRIQPSELMKLAMVVFAADLVARRERSGATAKEHWRSVVRPMLILLAFSGILIIKQPDMGTAIVLCCITFGVLYVGGIRGRVLGGVLGAVGSVGGIVALAAPYRRERLLSFLNPLAHAGGSGYQVVQSLVALQQGGVTGTGVGRSTAPLGFLPNAHTDFVFAVVGSELGLLGALFVIALVGVFAWHGTRVAARAEDRFSSLLAAGITWWIVCQAAINIGGVIGVLPVTGIPLPFVSFGGSSLVVTMLGAGVLVGIARRTARHAELAAASSPARAAALRAHHRSAGKVRDLDSRRTERRTERPSRPSASGAPA
jgi:cell division protein FtsW